MGKTLGEFFKINRSEILGNLYLQGRKSVNVSWLLSESTSTHQSSKIKSQVTKQQKSRVFINFFLVEPDPDPYKTIQNPHPGAKKHPDPEHWKDPYKKANLKTCPRLCLTGTWLRTSPACSIRTTTCSRARSCASSRSTSSAPPRYTMSSGASSTPSLAPGIINCVRYFIFVSFFNTCTR